MAFQLIQTFDEADISYDYDRERDVLYISFGGPDRAVAVQVEDWLALRLRLEPPGLAGMTIVGFRKIFSTINPEVELDIPERVDRLRHAAVLFEYDDQTDTLIMRIADEAELRALRSGQTRVRETLSVFERLADNVYVEKSLPANDLLAIKILGFTKSGPAAMDSLFGAILDTMFSRRPVDENATLVTRSLIGRLDWSKLRLLAA